MRLSLVLGLVLALATAARADIDDPTRPDPAPSPAPAPAPLPVPGPGGTPTPPAASPGVGTPREELPRFGVDAFLWIAGFRGKFEREREGNGSEVHLHKGDIGLESPSPAFSARASFRVKPGFHIELDYFLMYMGDDHGLTGRSFVMDSDFYPADTPIRTRVQVESGSLVFRVGMSESDALTTSFLFGGSVLEERIRIKNLETREESKAAAVGYTPFIGFHFGGDYGFVGWDMRFRVFAYHTGKTRVAYCDAEALAHIDPTPNFNMHVGFRFIGVDYHYEDGHGDSVGDWAVPAFVMGIGFRL